MYSIADVVIGNDLVIKGTSNREGQSIIVRVKGPIDLGTKFATVENGIFNVNFSTFEALTGEYTAEANDGEGHTDKTSVNITTPVRAVVSPTPAPTPALITPQEMPASTPPTQSKNSSASNSATMPVPGFGVVFVLAALLVVHPFLMSVPRRKRE